MIQSPVRLLIVRTMRETHKTPGVPFGASGVFVYMQFFERSCGFFRVGAFSFCPSFDVRLTHGFSRKGTMVAKGGAHHVAQV